MIARMWHGTVAASKAGEYRKFLNRRAIPDYGSVEGNKGVFIFERLEGTIAHFMTLSFWESEEKIAEFAGHDIEVEVEFVNSIPLTASGKKRFVISESPPKFMNGV